MASLTQILLPWHDFYALIGEASATLVALIFVAGSIGAGVFTREHQAGIRSFLSPTVVHFATILLVCLIASLPGWNWGAMGMLVACVGAIGLGYSGWVWHRMRQHGIASEIDAVDRVFYAQLPIPVHLMIIAAGWELWQRLPFGLEILAAALILLLLIGIRNAWDMTVWVIDRRAR